MRAFDLATSQPWAIQEDTLRLILDIAASVREDRAERLEAVQAQLGKRLENTRTVRDRDGVAVIPINGPIFRYANLFSSISGGTSTEELARDIKTALDNPDVSALLLEVDSPGGEAVGIGELAGMIHEGREKKPILAYVDGVGASAAYWLASAASEIILSPTALVGSIGTVMACRDTRERDSKAGVKNIEIVSSQSPNKRPDVTTDEGKAQVQTIVDRVTDVFLADVARYRGVTLETVLSDFGQGGVLVGQDAVDAKMADRTGTFEQVLAQLADRGAKRQRFLTAAQGGTEGTMSDTEKKPSLWSQFVTLMGGSEEETKVVAAQAEPPVPDPRVDRLEQQLKDERDRRIKAEADGFAESLIQGCQALPGEREKLVRLYTQAAEDDHASPMADGSRVSLLREREGARTKHQLTTELLRGDLSERGGLVLVNPEGKSDEMSDTRRKELLSKTPLGDALLKNGKT